MNWKKFAVLMAGIAVGEFAFDNFVGPMLVGPDKLIKPSEGIGLDEGARWGTSAVGVLLLQQLL